jgi:serine protease inhibitor
MRTTSAVLSLALALGLAGCESIFGPRDSKEPLTQLPRALSAAEQQVIQSSNRFAFDLLRGVAERDTVANVFLSPLSASMALGMTMNGARGETFDGMRGALAFDGMSQQAINESYRSLIDLLLGLDRNVDMRIANAIWVRKGFPLEESFVQTARQFFDATTRELDFADPASLGIINGWAAQATNNRIRTILEEPPQEHMMLYLMNAIYFKGTWTQQFDPRQTQPAPFFRADGGQHQVQMMGLRQGDVRAYGDEEVEVVDLPYGRQAYSMTLVLPRHGRQLDQVLASLDAQRWQRWVEGLRPTKLDVHLPRFTLEYQEVLNETLKALGMEVAFTPGAADFTGMSPVGRQLYIDEVLQKTFLEVNEQGTEAAAITSVGIGLVSAPPSFRADRPFLLVIRERLSGTILFIGTIGAPRSS